MLSSNPSLNLSEKQAKAKDAALRKKYSITLDEFTAILEFQGWRCPICGIEYASAKLWAVDHEHRSGQEGPVRGVLCFRCNRYKVGNLKTEESKNIYTYLNNPPAYKVLGGERIAKGIQRKRRRSNRSKPSSSVGVRGKSKSK
jgi:hypothetical protein